jgi:hypothetical protein
MPPINREVLVHLKNIESPEHELSPYDKFKHIGKIFYN